MSNKLAPMELQKCSVMAVHGKTICGSGDTQHKAYHVISAFVAESQITLEEAGYSEKTNEITAVPELVDLIDVKGVVVTADEMNYKKDGRKNNRDKGRLYNVIKEELVQPVPELWGIF